jgi:hypothetical protein
VLGYHVGESVKLNVVLTIIEISGLMLVIMVGLWAFTRGGDVDFSRVVAFDTATDKNAFVAVTTATSLAFFAMVGFEDSVNMAEETKDPVRTFPRVLLSGLSIAGIVYILVAIVAVALVPIGTLEESETPLVEVVKAGAPGLPIEDILPFISMFAVSNTALINMLMASRLIYGMARQHVLPPVLGTVHPHRHTPWVAIVFTTLIAFGLIRAGRDPDRNRHRAVRDHPGHQPSARSARRGHHRPDASGRHTRLVTSDTAVRESSSPLTAPARAGFRDAKGVRGVRRWVAAPRVGAVRATDPREGSA